MSTGLCPTRASRAWEPRYKFIDLKEKNSEKAYEILDYK